MKYFNSGWLKKAVVIDIIAALLILLFIYTGISKLTDYRQFSIQMGQSPILTPYAGFVAWSLPTIEILVAFMLAIPRLRLAGFYISFSLMVMFTAYIITILNASYHVPCHCGGVLEDLSWRQHIVFNVFFFLLSLAGVLIESKSRIQSRPERPQPPHLAYH